MTNHTEMEDRYFNEENFEKQDFTNGSLAKGEYENCTFRDCNFANADLSGIRFSESEFTDCNFSNAGTANTSFQDVVFKNCKMLGLRFDRCNPFGFAASFDGCQLNHSTFYQMKLARTSFVKSQLEGVDFTGSELKNIPLTHCDLLNAAFENTNLEKADLRNSFNYAIDPEINNVKGARFSLPEVIGLLTRYDLNIDTEG